MFPKNIFGKGTSLSLPRPCPIIHPLHTTPNCYLKWRGGGRNKRNELTVHEGREI